MSGNQQESIAEYNNVFRFSLQEQLHQRKFELSIYIINSSFHDANVR